MPSVAIFAVLLLLLAAWFGPKGFVSVTFDLMRLNANMTDANHRFHLPTPVIFGSIVTHSSTAVISARWFHDSEKPRERGDQVRA